MTPEEIALDRFAFKLREAAHFLVQVTANQNVEDETLAYSVSAFLNACYSASDYAGKTPQMRSLKESWVQANDSAGLVKRLARDARRAEVHFAGNKLQVVHIPKGVRHVGRSRFQTWGPPTIPQQALSGSGLLIVPACRKLLNLLRQLHQEMQTQFRSGAS